MLREKMTRENFLSAFRPIVAYLSSEPDADFEEKGRRSLMTVFLLILVPPLLFFGFSHIQGGHYSYGVSDILLALLFLGLIYAVQKTARSVCVYRLAAAFIWLVLVFWLYEGPFEGYASLWVLAFPLFVFFLLGRKEGAIWTLALMAAALLIFLNPGSRLEAFDYAEVFLVRHMGALLLVFLITYYYEFVREKYKKNFEAKQAELQAHQRNLEAAVEARTAEIRRKNEDQARLIDEQQRTEAALRESEEKYRTILENIEEGYYEVDPAGSFTFFNPPVARILGYSHEETMGLNYRAYTVGKSAEDLFLIFNRVFTTGTPAPPFSHEIVRSDGATRHVEISASLKRDAAGRPEGFRGIIRDVTAREQAEQQLRHTQKMEAIGTLTGGVAHDFNNILSIIMGYTEILQEEVPEGGFARRSLEMIQSATWRARDVVRHLLTFSRKGEESHSPQEINIILKEALKMMRSTTPASIEIREDIPNQLPLIIADPTQIHQVIVNLCKNAVDAMDADGGRLTVRVEPVSLSPEDVVNEPELPAGEFVRLTVSDTGCGIAAEDRERIFDPYFTTKAVDKGTGLGLSVVMGIVKSHGGAIRVTSEPNQGTSVETCFPVASHLSLEQAVPSTHEPPGGDERILFVDDEQAVAELNQLRLENFGYSVTTRTDPVNALDSFRLRPEAFDLVITDMTMPKMSGDRLIKEILEIRPDMKIILCTGYSERISEEAALSLGASAFLEKPVDRESLAESVRAALDARPGGGE